MTTDEQWHTDPGTDKRWQVATRSCPGCSRTVHSKAMCAHEHLEDALALLKRARERSEEIGDAENMSEWLDGYGWLLERVLGSSEHEDGSDACTTR